MTDATKANVAALETLNNAIPTVHKHDDSVGTRRIPAYRLLLMKLVYYFEHQRHVNNHVNNKQW